MAVMIEDRPTVKQVEKIVAENQQGVVIGPDTFAGIDGQLHILTDIASENRPPHMKYRPAEWYSLQDGVVTEGNVYTGNAATVVYSEMGK